MNHPPLPSSNQKLLVNIAFVIQFYQAALGHLVICWDMYRSLLRPMPNDDEGRFIIEIFVSRRANVQFDRRNVAETELPPLTMVRCLTV